MKKKKRKKMKEIEKTSSTARVKITHIEAAGIQNTGKKGSSSKVQLVNLAPYNQNIPNETT